MLPPCFAEERVYEQETSLGIDVIVQAPRSRLFPAIFSIASLRSEMFDLLRNIRVFSAAATTLSSLFSRSLLLKPTHFCCSFQPPTKGRLLCMESSTL
jgi:hypothetical protein